MDKIIGDRLAPVMYKAVTLLRKSRKTISALAVSIVFLAILNAANPAACAAIGVFFGIILSLAIQIGCVGLVVFLIMRKKRNTEEANPDQKKRTDQRFI